MSITPSEELGAERDDYGQVAADHRHPHERVLLEVVHAPAPGEERLDLTLAAVLGTGAHAALPHPSHEEIDVRRPEGSNRVGQLELVDCAPELAQRLCVGLDRAVRLALYCAVCEVEGDEFGECGHVDFQVRWSHDSLLSGMKSRRELAV